MDDSTAPQACQFDDPLNPFPHVDPRLNYEGWRAHRVYKHREILSYVRSLLDGMDNLLGVTLDSSCTDPTNMAPEDLVRVLAQAQHGLSLISRQFIAEKALSHQMAEMEQSVVKLVEAAKEDLVGEAAEFLAGLDAASRVEWPKAIVLDPAEG